MAESLLDVKDRLKSQFLGKGGIHGVGISQAQNAIRVYVSSDLPTDSAPVLEQIRKEAKPYRIVVIQEEPPSLSSTPPGKP